MIPKIIHFCWLSGDPYPANIQKYIDTWHKVLPDYELRLWDLNRFPLDKCIWVKEAFESKKYAFAADYIRNYALYNEGGIYLDADVEVLKPFNPLLHLPYMLDFENGSPEIDAGVMGTEPYNPIFKAMLDYYEGRHFKNEDGTLNTLPLPKLMRRVLTEKGFVYTPISNPGEFDFDKSHISILPYYYFSPIHLEHRMLQVTEQTIAIHRFVASWEPWYRHIKRTIKRIVGPKATRWFIANKRRLLGKR